MEVWKISFLLDILQKFRYIYHFLTKYRFIADYELIKAKTFRLLAIVRHLFDKYSQNTLKGYTKYPEGIHKPEFKMATVASRISEKIISRLEKILLPE